MAIQLGANQGGKTEFRFDHFGVSVTNIEEALEFWKVVLQAEPSDIWEGKRKKYLDDEVGYVDCYIRIAWIDMPQGQLEILEYVDPKPGKIDPESYNAGHMHFCFGVADIDAEFERLKAAELGIEFRSNAVVVVPEDDPDFPGYKCLYFRTPDGSTIELAQILD